MAVAETVTAFVAGTEPEPDTVAVTGFFPAPAFSDARLTAEHSQRRTSSAVASWKIEATATALLERSAAYLSIRATGLNELPGHCPASAVGAGVFWFR